MSSINGNAKRFIVAAPSLTSAVINQGVVLAYMRSPAIGNGTLGLPWTYATGAGQFAQADFRMDVNKIVYFVWVPLNAAAPIPFGAIGGPAQFRYVIIPGGVGGGRSAEKSAEIKGAIYTESELKSMSYQQICQLLNIPQ